jgi:hypothetical protein
MGQVSALTWVLTVDPTLLSGGPEVVSVAKEAFALADKEEALLLQRLPGRNLSLEALTQLRVACMDLLNVMMAWEPFRNYPEPVRGPRCEILAAVHIQHRTASYSTPLACRCTWSGVLSESYNLLNFC